MNNRLLALPVLAITATFGALQLPDTDVSMDMSPPHQRRWEVTVTNLTRGQIASPAVVAVHSRNLSDLWTLGEPASPELTMIAEDADAGAMINMLQQSPHVGDVEMLTSASGPIAPGESASVIVTTNRPWYRRLSLAGMLVTTNDAFYGVSGMKLPHYGSTSMVVPAYDAGTEANTEDCAHIPGPPCGNAHVRVTQGAEGYVHVHAGVHGGASLDPAQYDWRNPTIRIEVRRL